MMKTLSCCLLLAAFAAVQSGQAQANASSTSARGLGAGETVTVTSSIRRPSTPTPAPAAKGEAKPLEARLTKDEKGKQDASAFPAGTTQIYLQFSDDGAAKGDQLRVVCLAEDAKGYSKNSKVTEFSRVMPGPRTAGTLFLTSSKGAFPEGKYRTDIYAVGKLAKSLKFTVGK